MRKIIGIAAVASVALLAAGCNKLQSRDQLNKGVQAFKNAQYPDAVEKFKRAVELDPTFDTARLYLATAYMQQYIPGAESPENKQMAQAAFDNFQKVLDHDPRNDVAIASIASLYLNQKNWSEARKWYEKLTAVSPSNATAYYSLGFLAWSEWYPEYQKARAELGMKQEDPGPIKDKKVKDELKAKYGPIIANGIKNLDQALKIDPDYDDAMAYENLLVRESADLVDSKQEYEAEVKKADDWVQRAMDTKKRKAEKASKTGGGIVAEQPQ
ncbi:MAG: tetratricopeptide repeat protein [Acidobacteriia bacterium]|nr:tetratricopeptide repeat protein [Terriglobia bacterium]